jgi:hypothetical protein
MSNEDAETSPLIAVMNRGACDGNRGACDGFLLNRGPRGIEAFDAAEKPLGVFPDAPGAVAAVRKSVTPAHSRFGGSVATRVLRCRGSVRLVEKVPAHLRRISADAERGTTLHTAMALLIDNARSLDGLGGETIDGYTVTRDDVEDALRPAYAHVAPLLDAPGAEFYLEQRVTFPTVPNAFGTSDLIVRIGDTIHVVDFKFGRAVRVLAFSPADDDPAVDIINGQLLFYGAGARHSLPEFFAGIKNIILTIVQPMSIELDAEMVSSVTVTHAELDEFIAAYRAACEQALSPAPHLERGAWCRFCPAKPICPLHTAPLLDLARFVVPAPLAFDGALAAPPAKEAYLQALADGLILVNAIKPICTALHDQAKHALENGDAVPGYALTAGRAERHWRDDEHTTIAALERLGLTRDDIIATAMRSPKQVEIRAKARGLKIPQEFIVSRRSGTSLVRSENARAPVPARSEIVRSFTAALEIFQKGGRIND